MRSTFSTDAQASRRDWAAGSPAPARADVLAVPSVAAAAHRPELTVLHVLHTPRAEGTVKLVLDWLAEPGLRQEVLVLNPQPPEMTAQLEAHAAWLGHGAALPAGWAKFPWMLGLVWRTSRQRRPDLVICWANGFSPWVLLGAWFAGTSRLITHAGNPPDWHWHGKLQTVLSTFVAWMTRGRMVCCSHYVAGQYARSPGAFTSTLRVVANCAPVERIGAEAAAKRAARPPAPPRVVMVATLEAHKDHATLLRAMPAVRAAIPSVELWLVGDGSLRSALQAQAAALELDGTVQFLGSRRDVPALLGLSDVFVFSTTMQEGLGTVLIEALAAGLPIVASDVPACRETLEAGKWGTLVPAGDPAALAAALIQVLARAPSLDPAARREHLVRFQPAHMIRAYLHASA